MKTLQEKLKYLKELNRKHQNEMDKERKEGKLKEINRVSAMPKHQKELVNYLKEIGQIK